MDRAPGLTSRDPQRMRTVGEVRPRHPRFVVNHIYEENTVRQEQQRQLDSIVRVQDFVHTHAELLRGLQESDVLKQLKDSIAAIFDHGNTQGTTQRSLAGQTSRQRALEKQLVRSHMIPIAKFARAKLRGAPDFAALTPRGDNLVGATLLRSARSMATAAAPYADALTAGGFPADTIAQFTAAIDAVSDAIAQRGHLRYVRVGSTKGIAEQIARGREAVKLLDAAICRQFAFDETFLAAWASASRVDLKPGTPRAASPAAAANQPGDSAK
jgi:hypothetical protein